MSHRRSARYRPASADNPSWVRPVQEPEDLTPALAPNPSSSPLRQCYDRATEKVRSVPSCRCLSRRIVSHDHGLGSPAPGPCSTVVHAKRPRIFDNNLNKYEGHQRKAEAMKDEGGKLSTASAALRSSFIASGGQGVRPEPPEGAVLLRPVRSSEGPGHGRLRGSRCREKPASETKRWAGRPWDDLRRQPA